MLAALRPRGHRRRHCRRRGSCSVPLPSDVTLRAPRTAGAFRAPNIPKRALFSPFWAHVATRGGAFSEFDQFSVIQVEFRIPRESERHVSDTPLCCVFVRRRVRQCQGHARVAAFAFRSSFVTALAVKIFRTCRRAKNKKSSHIHRFVSPFKNMCSGDSFHFKIYTFKIQKLYYKTLLYRI
jgi:hypothetical protein